MGQITRENVADVLRYHPPTAFGEVEHYEQLETAAAAFADAILSLTPECADRSTALRCLREAKMWGSSAIALKGLI